MTSFQLKGRFARLSMSWALFMFSSVIIRVSIFYNMTRVKFRCLQRRRKKFQLNIYVAGYSTTNFYFSHKRYNLFINIIIYLLYLPQHSIPAVQTHPFYPPKKKYTSNAFNRRYFQFHL